MTSESAVAPSFSTAPVALAATGVAKNFGATAALVDANLVVRKGTIHALLGGNGSGKSTIIKCIAGVYQADAGTIQIHDQNIPANTMTPALARKSNLRFVHQDLGLFPQLSIAENIGLYGAFPTRGAGAINWRSLNSRVADMLERFDIAARPTDLVGMLRPSQRSMVGIARALEGQEDGNEFVLLLDEPTATLAEHEADELMTALRTRADLGQTIVLVSHRFPEVQGVADEVTVFRDGRVAATDRMSAMPIDRLVQSMTGGATAAQVRSVAAAAGSEARFVIDAVSSGAVRDATVTVARGEVVGLAGLGGSGRSSLLRAAFGIAPLTSGTMTLDGATHAPASPAAAMGNGVAFVPEDRHGEAAFLQMSVRENTSISVLDRFWGRFRMDGRKEKSQTAQLIRDFNIRTQSAEAPLGSLSGGNQQKAMIARWLQRKPTVLLLDEPTQGVDVVARSEIYASVGAAAKEGCAVLVASSDLDELMTLTNRILVMRDGRITAELRTSETTRDEISHLMMLNHA